MKLLKNDWKRHHPYEWQLTSSKITEVTKIEITLQTF
jgi:hypothetical protein